MKIRKSQKRWVAKMLVLVMLITCLPMTQKQEARAAGGVYNKLVSLKTRFPDGKFWNQIGRAHV